MKTTSLRYTVTKLVDNGNTKLKVSIRLDDECKNGHQDFSITADGREKNLNNGRFYDSFGGCCHDIILKHFPEFKIFIDLHLCDYDGAPMYAVENGFYHLIQGFDNLKGKTQKEYFCDYYRVYPAQYDELIKSENKIHFAILLKNLGILEQWKKESKKAIKALENLTGNQFVNDSKKSQFKRPTDQQIHDFNQKVKEGYYLPEQTANRAEKAKNDAKKAMIDKIKKEAKKVIDKAQTELKVKLWLISKDISLENVIYYNHSNIIKFNWLDYAKKMSEHDFNTFVDGLKQSDFEHLPNNIEFELDKVRRYSSRV